MVRVNMLRTSPDAQFPEYARAGDAGADVRVIPNKESYPQEVAFSATRCLDVEGKSANLQPGDYILMPHKTIMVDLGFKMELPYGYEIQVRSRSGLAKRGISVANSPGTIDCGYRGPCMVLLTNNNDTKRILKPGTRVAQFVLKRAPQAEFVEVEELSLSDRGEGGFGSTGVK